MGFVRPPPVSRKRWPSQDLPWGNTDLRLLPSAIPSKNSAYVDAKGTSIPAVPLSAIGLVDDAASEVNGLEILSKWLTPPSAPVTPPSCDKGAPCGVASWRSPGVAEVRDKLHETVPTISTICLMTHGPHRLATKLSRRRARPWRPPGRRLGEERPRCPRSPPLALLGRALCSTWATASLSALWPCAPLGCASWPGLRSLSPPSQNRSPRGHHWSNGLSEASGVHMWVQDLSLPPSRPERDGTPRRAFNGGRLPGEGSYALSEARASLSPQSLRLHRCTPPALPSNQVINVP
jgi:hypothetical protein